MSIRLRHPARTTDYLNRPSPVRPGKARTIILWARRAFIVLDCYPVKGPNRLPHGRQFAHRSTAKVNWDIQAIAHFPVDEGWVVLETPSFPDPKSTLGPNTLRIADDLRNYLRERDPNVLQVISFASDIEKPFNQMFHYAHPKYLRIPESTELSGNLWYLYLTGTAPGEMERYIPNTQATATCIRVLLRDHTYDTLTRLLAEIQDFNKSRVRNNPSLDKDTVSYMGGIAGLYAAANQVLKYTDFFNLTLTLMAVGICCAIEFRSITAGLLHRG